MLSSFSLAISWRYNRSRLERAHEILDSTTNERRRISNDSTSQYSTLHDPTMRLWSKSLPARGERTCFVLDVGALRLSSDMCSDPGKSGSSRCPKYWTPSYTKPQEHPRATTCITNSGSRSRSSPREHQLRCAGVAYSWPPRCVAGAPCGLRVCLLPVLIVRTLVAMCKWVQSLWRYVLSALARSQRVAHD